MHRKPGLLKLAVWGRAAEECLLDVRSGRWRIRRRMPAEPRPAPVGWASLEPTLDFTKRLHFRAGSRVSDVSLGAKRSSFWMAAFGFASGLVLEFEDGTTYRPVLIHPGRALWAHLDPTYDSWDAENDHFFLFMRQNLQDARWREALIERERNVRQGSLPSTI